MNKNGNCYCAIGDLSKLEVRGENLGFSVWCFDKSLLGRKFGIEKPRNKSFRKERRVPTFDFLDTEEPEELEVPMVNIVPSEQLVADESVQRDEPSLQRLMAKRAFKENLLSRSNDVAQKVCTIIF